MVRNYSILDLGVHGERRAVEGETEGGGREREGRRGKKKERERDGRRGRGRERERHKEKDISREGKCPLFVLTCRLMD